MSELLRLLENVAVQVFAVSSMAAVGLRYTVKEILAPLRNGTGVALALAANFVVVPALAYMVTRLIPLEPSFEVGLILATLAAGAPFVVKLTQLAGGDVAFSSGILVLLLLATILYMPLAVPFLVPAAEVGAWTIARPLLATMLLPLAAGLLLDAVAPRWAARLLPFAGRLASISLILVVVLSFVANLSTVLGVGIGAILVALLLVTGSFGIGWVFGEFGHTLRDEMALITAQRNFGAALVVATQSFEQPGVLVMVVVVSLISMAVLFPAAHWMGRRGAARTAAGKRPDARRHASGA